MIAILQYNYSFLLVLEDGISPMFNHFITHLTWQALISYKNSNLNKPKISVFKDE